MSENQLGATSKRVLKWRGSSTSSIQDPKLWKSDSQYIYLEFCNEIWRVVSNRG